MSFTEATTIDPRFSLLASKAAVELDNLVIGEDDDLKCVGALVRALKDRVIAPSAEGVKSSLADPMTIDVLSKALEHYSHKPMADMSALLNAAREVVEALQSAGGSRDLSVLERMRDFCVALARAARCVDEATYEDARAQHPFRA